MIESHLTFETLCDLSDGALNEASAEVARGHLRICAACSAQFASLTQLAASAASLPTSIIPPDDLWADIRREIAPSVTKRRPLMQSVAWLAAAGILVAVSSSGATYLYLRGRSTAAQAPIAAGPTQPTALPAHLASSEVRYSRDVEALLRTLAERRDSLAPSTVQTIERSLRVADSAIAEARAALAQDPSNGALAALFASNYERKIDLLKRAAELTPRT